jgi:hypothetical protein
MKLDLSFGQSNADMRRSMKVALQCRHPSVNLFLTEHTEGQAYRPILIILSKGKLYEVTFWTFVHRGGTAASPTQVLAV